jgi:hypothetical protein
VKLLASTMPIVSPHPISAQIAPRNTADARFAMTIGSDDIDFIFPDRLTTVEAQARAPFRSDPPYADHAKATLAVPPLEQLNIPRRRDRVVDASPEDDREGNASDECDDLRR